ncbi:MAG: hypothetical protein ACYCPQ_06030 [Elusimicrobiota bacterium]
MSANQALREIPRKLFHILSLFYFLAYRGLGPKRILFWMGPWTALVVGVEISRMAFPAFNRLVFSPFAGIARPEEKNRISGIFHTTLGTFTLFLFFRDSPRTVAAALGCAALGDGAAALFGKAFGRHKIFSGKTLEGSLACLAACAACGLAAGFSLLPSLLAATAATAVEMAPSTAFFNDNFWIPVVAAIVIHWTG